MTTIAGEEDKNTANDRWFAKVLLYSLKQQMEGQYGSAVMNWHHERELESDARLKAAARAYLVVQKANTIFNEGKIEDLVNGLQVTDQEVDEFVSGKRND